MASSMVIALVTLLAFAPSTSTPAAPPVDPPPRLRVQLEHGLLAYTHTWAPDSLATSDGVGFGRAQGLGLGLGYVVNRNLVIGATLSLGLSRTRGEIPEHDIVMRLSQFEASLRPHVEYVFLPDRRVRPFVLARVGATLVTSVQGFGSSYEPYTRVRPQVGGGVGVHAFVLPRLSVHVLASLDYGVDLEVEAKNVGAMQVAFGGTVGLSLWLGRRPAKRS